MQPATGQNPAAAAIERPGDSSLLVIALDPGVTTGYAIGKVVNKELEFVCGQDRWLHRDLFNWLVHQNPNIIVYETFEYRNRQRDGLELYSKELIGVINLYAQEDEKRILVSQHPSQVMGFFTNKKLKKEDCYYPNSEHPRDATRHLLHWWKFGAGSQYSDMDARSLNPIKDYRMTGVVK